jgi:hypothetical protein
MRVGKASISVIGHPLWRRWLRDARAPARIEGSFHVNDTAHTCVSDLATGSEWHLQVASETRSVLGSGVESSVATRSAALSGVAHPTVLIFKLPFPEVAAAFDLPCGARYLTSLRGNLRIQPHECTDRNSFRRPSLLRQRVLCTRQRFPFRENAVAVGKLPANRHVQHPSRP